MRINELRGKKIAIWGLGKEGWATLRAIRKQLPDLTIHILNDCHLSEENQKAIVKENHTRIFTGGNALDFLSKYDVVIKSPGISLYRPEIKRAKSAGVIFTSPTDVWFSEHYSDKILCVTGTKGKSTTASLIYHMLSKLGFSVVFGGNMGVPIIDKIHLEPSPDIWILELSSYQTSDLEHSPSVGVLLNLFPEHLDWHGDVKTYFNDKINLFKNIKNGISILNYLDENIKKLNYKWSNPCFFNDPEKIHIREESIYDGERLLVRAKDIKLQGRHNLSNICAALTSVSVFGVNPEKCVSALCEFEALPHRLSCLGEQNGVLFVDDSISTTPQSSMAAVEVFSDRPITIILGGFDRGLEWDELAHFLVTKPINAIITVPDSGIKIANAVRKAITDKITVDTPQLYEAESLFNAVEVAKVMTPCRGVVLLSPASPSYGEFRNFEDRGDAFAKYAGFTK